MGLSWRKISHVDERKGIAGLRRIEEILSGKGGRGAAPKIIPKDLPSGFRRLSVPAAWETNEAEKPSQAGTAFTRPPVKASRNISAEREALIKAAPNASLQLIHK